MPVLSVAVQTPSTALLVDSLRIEADSPLPLGLQRIAEQYPFFKLNIGDEEVFFGNLEFNLLENGSGGSMDVFLPIRNFVVDVGRQIHASVESSRVILTSLDNGLVDVESDLCLFINEEGFIFPELGMVIRKNLSSRYQCVKMLDSELQPLLNYYISDFKSLNSCVTYTDGEPRYTQLPPEPYLVPQPVHGAIVFTDLDEMACIIHSGKWFHYVSAVSLNGTSILTSRGQAVTLKHAISTLRQIHGNNSLFSTEYNAENISGRFRYVPSNWTYRGEPTALISFPYSNGVIEIGYHRTYTVCVKERKFNTVVPVSDMDSIINFLKVYGVNTKMMFVPFGFTAE